MTRAPISLRSPVAGIIRPYGWVRPRGSTDFRVTRTAAQHRKAGGPNAIDLGDANIDRDPYAAILAGKIVQHRSRDGVTTVQSTDGRWRVVGAHLAIDDIWRRWYWGKAVPLGAFLGRVSNTYPPPTVILAHLHLQVGQLVNGAWVWRDPWPLLVINQRAVLNGAGINIRSGPSLSAAIYATSRPAGIVRNGALIAPLGERMAVRQPATFTLRDGYSWVAVSLRGASVWIAQPLLHFDLA